MDLYNPLSNHILQSLDTFLYARAGFLGAAISPQLSLALSVPHLIFSRKESLFSLGMNLEMLREESSFYLKYKSLLWITNC